MNSSNLLKSALKPRNFSSSPRCSVSSPKKDRRLSNKPFITCENVSPTGNLILKNIPPVAPQSCLCSPTTHPGSFRCRLHRAPKEKRSFSTTSSAVRHVTKVSTKLSSCEVPVMTKALIKEPSKVVERKMLSSPSDSLRFQTCRRLEARPSRLSRVILAEDLKRNTFIASGKTATFVSKENGAPVLNVAAETPAECQVAYVNLDLDSAQEKPRGSHS